AGIGSWSASITRSASTRAYAIARRAKSTKQNAGGYVDDRLRRPAAPSPTSPPAQPPTTGLMLTRGTAEAMPSLSRRARSEPIPKSAGLHLRRRLRLSHDRGPAHTSQIRRQPHTKTGRQNSLRPPRILGGDRLLNNHSRRVTRAI